MLSPAAHDCFPFVDDLHFWNLQYLEWMNRGISASIDDYNNCNTFTSNNNTAGTITTATMATTIAGIFFRGIS